MLDTFVWQVGHQWFSADVFMSALRLRGVESNAPERCAEAFYCRKVVFTPMSAARPAARAEKSAPIPLDDPSKAA